MKKTPQLPEVRRNSDGMLMSTRDEVDARVAVIEDMMLRGEFKRGETARDLSKEWGIDLKTVQRYCSLASRLCWDDSDDAREELRAQSITKLLRIADEAHVDGKFKDATGAIKAANEVAGVLRPGPAVAIQNNTSVSVGRREPPQWLREIMASTDEVHARAVELVYWAGGERATLGECLETHEQAAELVRDVLERGK
jgi:hypothetical protein